jgi:poly(A) polymerase
MGERAKATLPQRWTAPVFPLKAADFIKRGVEKGPALGAALAAAEKAWIAAGFPADTASCRTWRLQLSVPLSRKNEKPRAMPGASVVQVVTA